MAIEKMIKLWISNIKFCFNTNRNLSLAMLRTTQIYLLSLTTCLYFQIAEITNLETRALLDNLFYSFTQEKILNMI